MYSLTEHFKLFKSNIQPDQARVENAKLLPGLVREHLQETSMVDTVPPHSRLVGSYARNTAIKDIKDVDLVLFVDPSYMDNEISDLFSDIHDALENLPSFNAALRGQRRSVNISFEDYDFDIDVVPVVAEDEPSDILKIPDKDWDKWIDTQPLGYAKALSNLNKDNGKKVVPLVKMLKHWRDAHMIYMKPKSYWLEAMVYHYFYSGTITTDSKGYAQLFSEILVATFDTYSPLLDNETSEPEIPDPMLGNDVAFNWDHSDFETFMNRVEESKKWSEKAISENVDENEAVELWQKIFNTEEMEWFPSGTEENLLNGAKYLAAAKEGNILVGTGGNVSIGKSSSNGQKSPPHRFYGE